MPIHPYGVLKCKAIDRRLGTNQNAHYQVHVSTNEENFRIAVNVKSQLNPSELLYCTIEHFQHVMTADLPALPFGFTPLASKPDGQALDYIRSNLFDRRDMVPLAFDIPGRDNDLNEKLDFYIRRAMETDDSVLYAFGERWGPEQGKEDKIFGFEPGNGIHNIHMNQGNSGRFGRDDGVYQDGGLLLHFPSEDRWIAVFLAFQSQSWHTDDQSGHAIGTSEEEAVPDTGVAPVPAKEGIRIAGAVVLPEDGAETVTLLNATNRAVDLTEWAIANKAKRRYKLQGVIRPGQFMSIPVTEPGFLRDRGDIITLLDRNGLKAAGVSYTRHQVKRGWTILF
ncbi:DUF2278 family protein [Paenibacillus sp. IB182493]|uniref:DUF2278 family protein n=1 Tax=Paenibacillus arenilitoris TaxID=2772299 RepID=A0A927CIQ8_9BACL|nr:DUF2278 family protein [Paenibacillus arenilitoris]